MQAKLALTITANDQTGLVERVANAVADAGGSWQESSMSHLAGKFAGIVLATVPEQAQAELEKSLASLTEAGIQIDISPCREDHGDLGRLLALKVVGNDRPGIIQELTSVLASLNVNVESLDTCCDIAPMSSEQLFEASAVVILPESLDDEGLEKHLQSLSDDLMVEIQDIEPGEQDD